MGADSHNTGESVVESYSQGTVDGAEIDLSEFETGSDLEEFDG
jgi:hypothetical protein